MIVPMKKIVLLAQAKDAENTLKSLRKLGVLHLEHIQVPKGKDISALLEDILLIERAATILVSNYPTAKLDTLSDGRIDWKKIAIHIVDIQKRVEQLKEYAVTLKKNIDKWRPWGDFEPQEVLKLRQNNIHFGFYQLTRKELKELGREFFIKEVSGVGKIVNCLIIAQGEHCDIPHKDLELPHLSLSAMQRRLEEDMQKVSSLLIEMKGYIAYYQELLAAKRHLERELEFYEARAGMGNDSGFIYIKGFAPVNAQELLLTVAKREGWAILLEDPQAADNVPTLLKNPRWVTIISPLFRFLEILPGYSELDISLPFLIFFSLFFGILIGDAGYGLAYLAITFFLQRRLSKRNLNPALFHLFYILSLCAIAFGLLTGTFFGQEWLVKLGIRPLVPALNDMHNLQAVCFFIGALHLTIAHSWRAILKMPALSALADIGWISVLWTGFFLAKTLILGDAFPYFAKWLLISGATLVILFTNPDKNILKGILKGLGTLALNLMNNFTDVVSYVRLFAVGLAGVAIADAFNSMAGLVGNKGVLAIIISMLVLVIGHALGVVLGPVSVLVHGVRLNVLEFSGHANVTWSGFDYKPFKEG
jgi:V/A-type H+-transporting ATPase subunit I